MWHQMKFGSDQGMVGVVERPERLPAEPRLVVTLAGFAQAMSEKNYMFSNLRKKLSLHGQWVAQFDYRGHGDSAGGLEQTTVSSMVSDTLDVLRAVTAERPPASVYLIGHALGAVVAQMAALHWERETGQRCYPVLISPVIGRLTPWRQIVDREGRMLLEHDGAADASALFPGRDYYALSDFDPEQYRYMLRLGAHPLYLHGQRVGKAMLDELDALDAAALYNLNRHGIEVIVGEEDSHSVRSAAGLLRANVRLLRQTAYYHQHPARMDELLAIVQSIVLHPEERGSSRERI